MNQEYKPLPINEFITNNGYNINDIYINKFWNSIRDKSWIYIDDELIDWIGFNNISGKTKYMDIIKKNFKKDNDYKIYNYDEVKDIFHPPNREYEINITLDPFKERILNNLHNRALYIILHPRCFKKSLMMIRTERANDIRDYYVDIEELYFEYNKYQLSFENKELKQKLLLEKENKKIRK